MFGPAYAAVVTVGSQAFNALITELEQLVGNLTPPASASLHARLRGSSPNVPVVIGDIHVNEVVVQITGYKRHLSGHRRPV
jgi:hypothetical protein